MKKYLIYLFLMHILNACHANQAHPTKRDQMTNRVIKEFAEKMEGKGLYAVGFGGGADKGKTNYIKVAFKIDRNLDIPSARLLGVQTVNEFFIIINNNKELKDYLSELPFTPKNISITIFGKSPTHPEDINCVSASEGKIYYNRDDAEGIRYIDIHEETFEEAERILAENDN